MALMLERKDAVTVRSAAACGVTLLNRMELEAARNTLPSMRVEVEHRFEAEKAGDFYLVLDRAGVEAEWIQSRDGAFVRSGKLVPSRR
jgi:hypothetical protein